MIRQGELKQELLGWGSQAQSAGTGGRSPDAWESTQQVLSEWFQVHALPRGYLEGRHQVRFSDLIRTE